MQSGTSPIAVFWVIILEVAQGLLCWHGAYSVITQRVDEDGGGGGVLSCKDGWKFGVVFLLSFVSFNYSFLANELNMPTDGWVTVDSDRLKLYCSPWWCLQLSGAEGEISATSGWAKVKTIDMFATTCGSINPWGDLGQAIQGMQFWGILQFLGVTWTWLNHTLNMLCNWLVPMRNKLHVFHLVNVSLAIMGVSTMAFGYSRNFCGKSLQDTKFAGQSARLGVSTFWFMAVVAVLELGLGALCYQGVYTNLTSAPRQIEEKSVVASQANPPNLLNAAQERPPDKATEQDESV